MNIMIVEFKTYFCDGWWGAHATEHSIYTQGKTIGELVDNIIEATELHLGEEIEKGEQITIFATPESPAETTSGTPFIKFKYKIDIIDKAASC